jgi:uncharacterized cupredoxin-like copper-binding protein
MRKSIFLVTLLALFVVMASLAACTSKPAGPTVVQVKLNEYSIVLDQSSIPAGPVSFEIENVGTEDHEVVLEPAGANDEPFDMDGTESEAEDIHPGDKTTFEWTLDQPGEYQLSCYIINEGDTESHAMKGMITTFTVTAAQ